MKWYNERRSAEWQSLLRLKGSILQEWQSKGLRGQIFWALSQGLLTNVEVKDLQISKWADKGGTTLMEWEEVWPEDDAESRVMWIDLRLNQILTLESYNVKYIRSMCTLSDAQEAIIKFLDVLRRDPEAWRGSVASSVRRMGLIHQSKKALTHDQQEIMEQIMREQWEHRISEDEAVSTLRAKFITNLYYKL